MPGINILFSLIILLLTTSAGTARAEEQAAACKAEDRPCILGQLEKEAAAIEETAWRDQVYRELAKTLAFDGQPDKAIGLVDKIQNPDTKAMTIRGIGMSTADRKLSKEEYAPIFVNLRAAADKITHPPSYAIALTYVAMAQAFAGDNEGAWKTASEMENDALRHKAYAETAEIQAEGGDLTAALTSIGYIGDLAFRNKAYQTVAKILADRDLFTEALQASEKITNAYKKAETLQYILDKQKPRDVPHNE